MTDTAQLSGAAETDPNAQLANAADAFKVFDNPSAVQPRDESGRFAGKQPEETQDEPDEDEPEAGEPDEGEAGEAEVDEDADDEAAEEPAQPMPPSWGADDAELWATLPPEAQAKIAEREGERDRGLNLKLQDAANARKAYELKVQEASTKLDNLNSVIETVEAIYRSPEPDPRAFGYGTAQFNEAAYAAAHQQWQNTERAIAQLNEQRQAASKEQVEAEKAARTEWKQQHEAEYAPKLLKDVPELTDATKAPGVANGLVEYAVASGIPAEVFQGEDAEDITSAQLHILWKAQQFDKLRANKTPAKPKPAGPVVKPGVSSPRSAQKAARRQKDIDRLAREGSLEAGAAVFKHFL